MLKNIIFDLGGVLLDLDYTKTSDAFKKLGIKDFDLHFSQFTADELFEKLETGKISEEAFFNTVIKLCDKGTSLQEVENAWNAMMLDFRADSLVYLKQLKKQYSIYLLSNTNSIHLRAFQSIFTRKTGEKSLDVYFDKAYYSHLIGLRKPHLATYEYVLQDAGMSASETLFIDDSIHNIQAATQVGIKTHLLLSTEKIQDVPLK